MMQMQRQICDIAGVFKDSRNEFSEKHFIKEGNVLVLMSHNDEFYYMPYLDKCHTYVYTS